MHTEAHAGNLANSGAVFSPAPSLRLPWGQANVCRLLMREVQASHSSPVLPKCPLTSQGAQIHWTRPQDGAPNLWLSHSLPPVYSSFLTRLFFSTLTQLHVGLSYSLGCKRFFLPVSVTFHRNCCTHRCIFDVSLRGSEFHVFILCHPDWSLNQLHVIPEQIILYEWDLETFVK